MSDSLDTEIHVEDLNSEKKYFSQIPNIIHRMGLGPFVVAYYCLLKSIAGEKNMCFMSVKNLCETLCCSPRQLKRMNKFMSQPFKILGGKSLITIKKRMNKDKSYSTNLIIVNDIWEENVTIIMSKIEIPKTPLPQQNKSKNSSDAPGGSASDAPGGSASDALPSASDAPKQEPLEEEPHLEEVVCSSVPPVAESPRSEDLNFCIKMNFDNQEIKISLQDVFSEAVLKKMNWTVEEINESFRILRDYTGKIRSWFRFIEGTIEKLRNAKRHLEITKKNLQKNQQQQGKSCQNKQNSQNLNNESENIKKKPSEYVTLGQLFPNFVTKLKASNV